MTFFCGNKSSDSESSQQNKEIDKILKKDKKSFERTYKIPVVGAGESGKSTLIKQMQILYINGFTREDRLAKVTSIRGNVRDAILAITGAMDKINPPVKLDNPDNQQYLDKIKSEEWNLEIPDSNLYKCCEFLWHDKGVQIAFSRANEYQLIDSAKYFLDKVMETAEEDYLPTDQDILRCRMLTSGIHETKFVMKKSCFHMYDVGGQREERRKWIQVLSDVTSVIFVSACSGYDMTLREAKNQNRLRESVKLFREIWTNRYLLQTSVILFLNKTDLLVEKILSGKTKVETFFPEYQQFLSDHGLTSQQNHATPTMTNSSNNSALEDDIEVVHVKEFIKDMFIKVSEENDRGHSRKCYAHYTCAVDTENIKRVFEDCNEMMKRLHLEKLDLL